MYILSNPHSSVEKMFFIKIKSLISLATLNIFTFLKFLLGNTKAQYDFHKIIEHQYKSQQKKLFQKYTTLSKNPAERRQLREFIKTALANRPKRIKQLSFLLKFNEKLQKKIQNEENPDLFLLNKLQKKHIKIELKMAQLEHLQADLEKIRYDISISKSSQHADPAEQTDESLRKENILNYQVFSTAGTVIKSARKIEEEDRVKIPVISLILHMLKIQYFIIKNEKFPFPLQLNMLETLRITLQQSIFDSEEMSNLLKQAQLPMSLDYYQLENTFSDIYENEKNTYLGKHHPIAQYLDKIFVDSFWWQASTNPSAMENLLLKIQNDFKTLLDSISWGNSNPKFNKALTKLTWLLPNSLTQSSKSNIKSVFEVLYYSSFEDLSQIQWQELVVFFEEKVNSALNTLSEYYPANDPNLTKIFYQQLSQLRDNIGLLSLMHNVAKTRKIENFPEAIKDYDNKMTTGENWCDLSLTEFLQHIEKIDDIFGKSIKSFIENLELLYNTGIKKLTSRPLIELLAISGKGNESPVDLQLNSLMQAAQAQLKSVEEEALRLNIQDQQKILHSSSSALQLMKLLRAKVNGIIAIDNCLKKHNEDISLKQDKAAYQPEEKQTENSTLLSSSVKQGFWNSNTRRASVEAYESSSDDALQRPHRVSLCA